MRAGAGIGAALGWFALALQLYLIVETGRARGVPVAEAVIRFVSYFTILTNLLAAGVLTVAARARPAPAFLARPGVQAAVAVYIVVVGAVYVTILRHLWAPAGAQWLADALLHYVMPLYYVAFWLAFARTGTLAWSAPFVWLAFPLGYVLYALARGALSGFYPYPFVDASALGYAQVARNAAGLCALFLALGLVAVAIDRARGPRPSARA